MPTALAIARTLQCVAAGGVSRAGLASTLAFNSAGIGVLPGGRVLSRVRPSRPSSAKRRCQRHTHGFDLPVARATALTLSPSALARTIRARQTTFAGVLRSATSCSSATRCSADIVISVFIRPACLICQALGIQRQ